VADRQKYDGKEPLTEREREVLQELAREIVREAGLVPDLEAEAAKARAEAEEKRKEDFMDAYKRTMQAHIEFYKHMTTLSGASLVAAIAAYGAFLSDSDYLWVFYISLGCIAVAMGFSGVAFGILSQNAGRSTVDRRFWGDSPVDRDALLGNFWRNRTVDELVEEYRSNARKTQPPSRIAQLWYLGVSGCAGTIVLHFVYS